MIKSKTFEESRDLKKNSTIENVQYALKSEADGYVLPSIMHVTDISKASTTHLDRVYLAKTPSGWHEVCVPLSLNDTPIKGQNTIGLYASLARIIEKRDPSSQDLSLGGGLDLNVKNAISIHAVEQHITRALMVKQPRALKIYGNSRAAGFKPTAVMASGHEATMIFSKGNGSIYHFWGQENVLIPVDVQQQPQGHVALSLQTAAAQSIKLTTGGQIISAQTHPADSSLTKAVTEFLSTADRPTPYKHLYHIEWTAPTKG